MERVLNDLTVPLSTDGSPSQSREDMNEPADEELMARTADGDDDAFAQIVERHQHLVFGTVAKMLGGHHRDAEDVAQQVFIKAYRAAPRYRPSAKFTTWLLTIVRHCVFTHCARLKRKAADSFDYQGPNDEPHQWADPSAQDGQQILLQEELARILEQAVNQLPEQQRLALILRQYQDLDYEEIARVLNTSVSAVKSLLFRARSQLRAVLKKYWHDDATCPKDRSFISGES